MSDNTNNEKYQIKAVKQISAPGYFPTASLHR